MLRTDLISALGAGLVLISTAAPAMLSAQTVLTLEDAMARARTETPAARGLTAATAEAAARVEQARAGYYPRVNVSESIQRGNDPVFVFSTLLSQRRFTAGNFEIASLNEPAPVTNIRTAVAIEQPVFDAGLTGLGVRAAELGRDVAALERTQGERDLALRAAQAFVRVLQLEGADRASTGAVAAAESDLERARRRREVGLVTDADVLAVEVHLADVRQRQIATTGNLAVARLELTDALGLPLAQPLTLVKPMLPSAPADAERLAGDAIARRPESRRADLRVRLAQNGRDVARAALLPRVGVEAAWDFNGSRWAESRAGWIVGARIDLNVFNGFRDRARLQETRQTELRAVAEREDIGRRIEVEVRTAVARLNTAQAREMAGRAALAQARESQRIVRDRYDTGLATATDLLRAAEALLDAESRATAAEMEVILETIALDRAVGRL